METFNRYTASTHSVQLWGTCILVENLISPYLRGKCTFYFTIFSWQLVVHHALVFDLMRLSFFFFVTFLNDQNFTSPETENTVFLLLSSPVNHVTTPHTLIWWPHECIIYNLNGARACSLLIVNEQTRSTMTRSVIKFWSSELLFVKLSLSQEKKFKNLWHHHDVKSCGRGQQENGTFSGLHNLGSTVNQEARKLNWSCLMSDPLEGPDLYVWNHWTQLANCI